MAHKSESSKASRSETGTVSPLPPNGSVKAERLTLPLVSDGTSIDWEKIRPARRDELKALLGSSGVKATTAPAATLPLVMNEALCGTLYDLLAQVEAMAAARMFGCSANQAFAALKFSAEEKKALADPTARVINKYLPAALLEKYADECMLLLLLVTMTKGKIELLQDSLRVHNTAAPVKTETVKTS